MLGARLASLFGEALMRAPRPRRRVLHTTSTSSTKALSPVGPVGAARRPSATPFYLLGTQWWKAVFFTHFLQEIQLADGALAWRRTGASTEPTS